MGHRELYTPTNTSTVPMKNDSAQFGHTFSEHGAKPANKELADHARSIGGTQGQWTDNQQAADYLSQYLDGLSGPTTVPIPKGLGQVIQADNTAAPATQAVIVPSPTGIRTAYPIP